MIETPVPPLSTECLIKSIPDHLSRVKEQAYTPTIISIGPIHHFDPKLQIMETCKVWYFKSFISQTKINLENLVSTISEMEERIWSCYAETTLPLMHSDDFVKMILMDAVFILELFYRYSNHYWYYLKINFHPLFLRNFSTLFLPIVQTLFLSFTLPLFSYTISMFKK